MGALIIFISGHLDLTKEEFDQHYKTNIAKYVEDKCSFLVGDARGTDTLAQECLAALGAADRTTVFHMFKKPRNKTSAAFQTRGGFTSDEERDAAMTDRSHVDLAWVRPGREQSGTARNLARRNSGK